MEQPLAMGEFIRRVRRERRILLKDLARVVGVSHFYLSKIENDAAEPSAELLLKLAAALRVPARELFRRSAKLAETPLDSLVLARSSGVAADLRSKASELAQRFGLASGEAVGWAEVLSKVAEMQPEARARFLELVRLAIPKLPSSLTEDTLSYAVATHFHEMPDADPGDGSGLNGSRSANIASSSPSIPKGVLIAHCVQERDVLLEQYRAWKGLAKRPLPAEAIDGILDMLECDLIYKELPADKLAETDFSKARPLICINSAIDQSPHLSIKEAEPVMTVSKGHELGHIRLGHGEVLKAEHRQRLASLMLFPLGNPPWVCPRSVGANADRRTRAWEYQAETFNRVFMVPGWALMKSEPFLDLLEAARKGVAMEGGQLWKKVYDLAKELGVNPTFLTRVLRERGFIATRGTPPNESIALVPQLRLDASQW